MIYSFCLHSRISHRVHVVGERDGKAMKVIVCQWMECRLVSRSGNCQCLGGRGLLSTIKCKQYSEELDVLTFT